MNKSKNKNLAVLVNYFGFDLRVVAPLSESEFDHHDDSTRTSRKDVTFLALPGLPIRSNLRAGAYFSVTFSAGGGSPSDTASAAAPIG
jgi:hypothetical protein